MGEKAAPKRLNPSLDGITPFPLLMKFNWMVYQSVVHIYAGTSIISSLTAQLPVVQSASEEVNRALGKDAASPIILQEKIDLLIAEVFSLERLYCELQEIYLRQRSTVVDQFKALQMNSLQKRLAKTDFDILS